MPRKRDGQLVDLDPAALVRDVEEAMEGLRARVDAPLA